MNESHCSAQPSVQLSPCASPCRGAWHAGRGRKGTGGPGCPRDTQSHPSKASKRAELPACWALLCALTIQALPHCLSPQRPVLYWNRSFLLGSCHTSSITTWFSKLFSLISPALNFPVQLKANTDCVCQLVSNRQEKGKAESNNCSMLLCWINNTLKKSDIF